MKDKEYIIFCDESDKKGKYYSNFYGGLIVGSSQYQRVTDELNNLKAELNLYGEIKWEKVTERYLPKYIEIIKKLFEEIAKSNLKIRIMFHQNANVPARLTKEQVELEYYLLYYQFLKNAFGLEHIPRTETGTQIRIYLDKLPDTGEKAERFKGYLLGLQKNKKIKAANIVIKKENITEIRSHDHVLAQCLDIVLGSISFRLNDKHKEKAPGEKRRGKRTRAKEALYKVILREIRKIKKNFNIGISTRYHNAWEQEYMHWNFIPKESNYNRELTKRGKK
jgi:hypothetical protein